jgi:site-specific DNA-methyltransferase (adenine-specific)
MNPALHTSKKQDWVTPDWLFRRLDDEFHFDLDAAATDRNAKCEKYFTEADDGLKQNWWGHTVWCNPPYNKQIKNWVRKAYEERENCVVVMLIPARTETDYWHEYIFGKASEIRFLHGRLYFLYEDGTQSKVNAPFPSAVVVFGTGSPQKILTMNRE